MPAHLWLQLLLPLALLPLPLPLALLPLALLPLLVQDPPPSQGALPESHLNPLSPTRRQGGVQGVWGMAQGQGPQSWSAGAASHVAGRLRPRRTLSPHSAVWRKPST